MHGPHPGSEPMSSNVSKRSQPNSVGSNDVFGHGGNNAISGRYYQYEHGNDNSITQPTSGLTDVDVGFPPMPVYATEDTTITHGRAVVANPTRPGFLASTPVTSGRKWSPKGKSQKYKSDSANRRSNSNGGPGGSSGHNTY